jgi:TPR repeat protein
LRRIAMIYLPSDTLRMHEYGFDLSACLSRCDRGAADINGGDVMAFRFLLTLRSELVVLLSALCLLSAARVEAKRDTQDHNGVAELQTKAAQGFMEQELELAADYSVGRGVPKDLAQAAYWYRKAADQGNPAAQVNVGYMYAVGMGVPQDTAEAAKWYRRVASSDFPEAKVNLASLYLRGDGVKQDTGEALRLLKSAAHKGNGRADAYLGLASYLGSGIPVDHTAAEAWFKKGIQQHDPEAEYFLAVLESHEPGRVPDVAGEAELLRHSAAGGYVPAMHLLGLLLVNHPEVPQPKEEATDALKSAATAGSWQSSAVLGMLTRDGRLIPKDQRAAYRWFRIAVLQGGSPAESFLRAELQRLATSVPGTASVEQEASAWLELHPNHDVFVFKNELNPKYFPIQEVYATAQTPSIDEKAVKAN